MLHSKFNVYVDHDCKEVNVYLNSEFGMTIHTFKFNSVDDGADDTKFYLEHSEHLNETLNLIAQSLQSTSPKLLKYLISEVEFTSTWSV